MAAGEFDGQVLGLDAGIGDENAAIVKRRHGHSEVARTLQQTLDEEGQADKLLTHLATSEINDAASASA